MSNKRKKPALDRQPANTGYTNIVPSVDYFYLMIDLKAISLALKGGF